MKKFLLCGLLLSLVPAWADDPAPASAPSSASAPTDEKAAAIQINQLLTASMSHGPDSNQATWDAVCQKIDNYQKEFGITPQTTNNLVLLRRTQLKVAKLSGVDGRYDGLVQKLASDPIPEVAALVAKISALKTKPMDLKYTTVDGTAVDLSKLRGKVVLVDFWATWCPPCREEVPNVVAAYKKYHDQGFEIVGVSLDKDKDAMLAYTKDNGMTWPQYFDGKGWKNEVSQSFDINSIPAMWLLDKKGMLVTMDARDDLAGQIEKQLQAP